MCRLARWRHSAEKQPGAPAGWGARHCESQPPRGPHHVGLKAAALSHSAGHNGGTGGGKGELEEPAGNEGGGRGGSGACNRHAMRLCGPQASGLQSKQSRQLSVAVHTCALAATAASANQCVPGNVGSAVHVAHGKEAVANEGLGSRQAGEGAAVGSALRLSPLVGRALVGCRTGQRAGAAGGVQTGRRGHNVQGVKVGGGAASSSRFEVGAALG